MCLGIRWHVQGWAGKFKKHVLCIRLGNENDMISHMLVFLDLQKIVPPSVLAPVVGPARLSCSAREHVICICSPTREHML